MLFKNSNIKTSGIYKITNLINNKVYVGKTNNFYKRYYCYKSAIKRQDINKINQYFLNSINKYGSDNFEFSIIEFCNIEDLKSRELYWIKKLKSTNRVFGYNLRIDSSTKMVTHPRTSLKISNRLKKEWNDGIRSQHAKKLKNNWKNNADRKELQSELMTKILTKYYYNLYQKNGTFLKKCYYSDLKEMKLQNCIATFHKKQTNKIYFKNYIIERINIISSVSKEK